MKFDYAEWYMLLLKVILLPYNYLLEPSIREQLLEGNLVQVLTQTVMNGQKY